MGQSPSHRDDIEVESIVYTTSIKSPDRWQSFASIPHKGTNSLADTRVVKLLWHIQENGKYMLYYINTNMIEYHYDFVSKFIPREAIVAKLGTLLNQPLDLGDFNRHNYCESEKRQFIMGTLIYYQTIDKWAMELNPEDNIPAVKLLAIFSLVKDSVYFSKKLFYKPSSNVTEDIAMTVKSDKFNVISIQEIYQGVTYQCYNKGESYGLLKYIKKEDFDPIKIKLTDIVVVDFIPLDIPPCAGIITTCFQAPLCHISILCQNRGTPNAYFKNIAKFEKLYGKLVKFTVTMNNLDLKITTEKEIQVAPRKKIDIPKFSLDSVDNLLPSSKWVSKWCGTKAEHLAFFGNRMKMPEYAHILKDGFTIPFSTYFKHLEQLSSELIKNPTLENLSEIEKSIMKIEIETDVLKEIEEALLKLGKGPVIMRSSTNAEDLVGFNGAGLYLSEIVDDVNDPKKISHTIKKIWASVFSVKAFQERDLFQIEHERVGMAILVQPLICNPIAKGVAMTWCEIHSDFGSFLVNAQSQGGDVTDSVGVPEQICMYKNDEVLVQEVLTRSSLVKDHAHVLETVHLEKLWDVLNRLHKFSLVREWRKFGCAADVEFMVTRDLVDEKEIRITIVQIRPYLIPKQ